LDYDRQRRQLTVVVQAKAEELRRLQEGGDALVGLEHARDGSDQELPRLLQLLFGGAVAAERADLRVDGFDRALDVVRVHTRADDQRARPEARIERAERVIGHPLPLADIVGKPAAEPELAE